MRQRLFIAVLTVVAFGLGFGAGLWKEQHQPLPPPAGPLGSEFAHWRPHSPPGSPHGEPPVDRAELLKQAEAIRPQLDAFRAKMNEIDDGFNRSLDEVLNAEQRTQHDENLKRLRERRERQAGDRTLSADKVSMMLMEQSSRTILWDVVIPLRLDYLTKEYKLDEGQREKARQLLKDRREKVLQLVDSSPPPSVLLSRLAPWMHRLAHPGDRPPPPPPPEKP